MSTRPRVKDIKLDLGAYNLLHYSLNGKVSFSYRDLQRRMSSTISEPIGDYYFATAYGYQIDSEPYHLHFELENIKKNAESITAHARLGYFRGGLEATEVATGSDVLADMRALLFGRFQARPKVRAVFQPIAGTAFGVRLPQPLREFAGGTISLEGLKFGLTTSANRLVTVFAEYVGEGSDKIALTVVAPIAAKFGVAHLSSSIRTMAEVVDIVRGAGKQDEIALT